MWNILIGYSLIVDYAIASATLMSGEDGRPRGLPPSAYCLFTYSPLSPLSSRLKRLSLAKFIMWLSLPTSYEQNGSTIGGKYKEEMHWRGSVRGVEGGDQWDFFVRPRYNVIGASC